MSRRSGDCFQGAGASGTSGVLLLLQPPLLQCRPGVGLGFLAPLEAVPVGRRGVHEVPEARPVAELCGKLRLEGRRAAFVLREHSPLCATGTTGRGRAVEQGEAKSEVEGTWGVKRRTKKEHGE